MVQITETEVRYLCNPKNPKLVTLVKTFWRGRILSLAIYGQALPKVSSRHRDVLYQGRQLTLPQVASLVADLCIAPVEADSAQHLYRILKALQEEFSCWRLPPVILGISSLN